MTKFAHLFAPIQLGPIRLSNRIVFSAHLTNFAVDGKVSPQHVAYYQARARGGTGLIITEEHSTHPTDWPYEKMIHGFDPEVVAGYREITEAVHKYDCKIFAQINHNGAQGTSLYSRLPLWGPSPVMDPMFREIPKVVDEDDIEEIIAGYATVAKHAKLGGFDGIELQCSHSSIVRQFLSPLTNFRSDRWGVSIENRCRLMVSIIEATRAEIGPDMAIGVRICGDEMVEGGLNIDDAIEVAKIAEATKSVDYINTSIGVATQSLYTVEASMSIPPGYSLYIPAAIRDVVKLPVIGVGRFKDPTHCDRAIKEGKADLIGIVRGQIADPDFARKANEERDDEIRGCLSCNQECVGRMGLNRWLGCIENPEAGKEHRSDDQSPTHGLLGLGIGASNTFHPKGTIRVRRKVLIAGAGPAGLQAAISSARLGHQVIVLEKANHVGGAVAIAARAPHRAEFADLIRNQLNELATFGVSPQLGVEVDEDTVSALRPDAVVVATGSSPSLPWWASNYDTIKAHDKVSITHPFAILDSQADPKGTVVVYDELGFHHGTSIAELLADRGCDVTIVTPQLSVGTDLGVTLDLETWNLRAQAKQIRQMVESVAVGLTQESLSLQRHTTGESFEVMADWVVAVTHGSPNADLYNRLVHSGWTNGLYRIGDSVAPRRAHSAVIEGDLIGGLIG